MIVSRKMDVGQLRNLMGAGYTEQEARILRDLLVERGYSGVDTSYVVNSAIWATLLDAAEGGEA